MNEHINILTLKPEFSVTKIGVYNRTSLIFLKTICHASDVLNSYELNTDQYKYRGDVIIDELKKADIDISSIKIIMARGGLLKPIPSGIYEVNDAMKRDLLNSPIGVHSVNIGGLTASYIASKINDCKAYIADPAVVDELDDLARFTGFPDVKRKSIFHALNHKYVARKYARSIRKNYEDLNLIVAHLGDGISIAAHKLGRVVDVNQCFDGEGPFSLERAGTIPMVDLVKMCFSGQYTENQLLKLIRNEGGMFAHSGTSSYYALGQAEKDNNTDILKMFEAMAYQISKYIGYMAPVFTQPIDAVIITGILANNKWFTNIITERVKFIAPIHIFPGEDVLDALAMNGFRILTGDTDVIDYV